MKKKATLIALGILLIASVVLAVSASAQGARLARLSGARRALAEENEILTQKLVSRSSLAKIALEAQTLGMIKPENVIYLVDMPVAALP